MHILNDYLDRIPTEFLLNPNIDYIDNQDMAKENSKKFPVLNTAGISISNRYNY